MKKYLTIFWTIIKNAYIRDSKIDGYIVVSAITQLLYVTISLIFFRIIFTFTDNLAGWHYWEVLFLFGFARSVSEFGKTFYRSGVNSMSSELIRQGTFDFYLTKPVDSLALVSMSKPVLYTTISGFFSIGIMIYSLIAGKITTGWFNLLWFLILMACGHILYYCLSVIVIIPAFWLQKLWVLSSLIGKLAEVMRYPMGMFKNAIKLFVGFIFPIMIISYIPVRTLLYPPDYRYIAYMIVMTIMFGWITRKLWGLGIRSYSSASS